MGGPEGRAGKRHHRSLASASRYEHSLHLGMRGSATCFFLSIRRRWADEIFTSLAAAASVLFPGSAADPFRTQLSGFNARARAQVVCLSLIFHCDL